MKPGKFFLAFALGTGVAGNLQASTVGTFPPFVGLDNPNAQVSYPTFTNTPGQATTTAIVFVGGGTITGTDGTRCLVFPEPTFGCDGPAAPVGFTADLSVQGLTATGSASAGNDYAGTSLQVSSSGTSIPAFDFIQFNLISTDRQRLRFDVEGDDVPEFLEIDMTFSVYAELLDRSAIATGLPYLPQTEATIDIFEAATFPPGTTGPGLSPFQATAFRTSAGIVDGVGLVQTLMLRPNVEYWLWLESQSVLSLTPAPVNGVFDVRDYAGLDVEMSSWADPRFALSADFAAANPDIAAAFTVNRIAVVPVPATLPLLLSALVGAGLLGRQQVARSAS